DRGAVRALPDADRLPRSYLARAARHPARSRTPAGDAQLEPAPSVGLRVDSSSTFVADFPKKGGPRRGPLLLNRGDRQGWQVVASAATASDGTFTGGAASFGQP